MMMRSQRVFVGASGKEDVRKIRGSIDVMAQMLAVCKNGAKRTEIMYKANLSHEMLKRYLKVLIKNGLVSNSTADGVYRTTLEGFTVVRLYEEVVDLLNRVVAKKSTLLESLNGS